MVRPYPSRLRVALYPPNRPLNFLVVAFREFSVITEDTIISERRRFRAVIADEIESFAKRAAVRNLKSNGKFSKEQM